MKINRLLTAALCLAAALLSPIPVAAKAGSWDSYTAADLSGIYLTPSFADGVTTYTVAIADDAAIIIPEGQQNAGTYKVNWIQSFSAYGTAESTSFVAAGHDSGDWTWSGDSSKGGLYGWSSSGNERISAGRSRTFKFDSFVLPKSSTAITALHIGYGSDGKGGNLATGFFSATPAPYTTFASVPEPSGSIIMALGMAITTGLTAMRKRLY